MCIIRIFLVCFRNDIVAEKFKFPEPINKKTTSKSQRKKFIEKAFVKDIKEIRNIKIAEVEIVKENVEFKLPKELR